MSTITTSNFKRLLGTWNTSGKIITKEGNMELRGTDSYEWILDRNFILHKAHVMMGDENGETHEIIIPDSIPDTAQMQYFNSKGEHGIMRGELTENTFIIRGEGIIFEGIINEDDTQITGHWYLQSEHDTRELFIELKLEKR